MRRRYETPEVIELGAAENFTLGCGGESADNCNCCAKHVVEIEC
jgi:hypothetical protein